MLDVIDVGTPRMNLDHTHLNQTKQPIEVIDPYPCALATLTLFYPKLMDCRGDRGKPTHVVEGRPVHAADELQRSTTEIVQGAVRDQAPISSQFVAGWNDRIRQKLKDVL